jgi:hypothetical protein
MRRARPAASFIVSDDVTGRSFGTAVSAIPGTSSVVAALAGRRLAYRAIPLRAIYNWREGSLGRRPVVRAPDVSRESTAAVCDLGAPVFFMRTRATREPVHTPHEKKRRRLSRLVR